MFTGREAEIRNVITFLLDEKKAVVSLHGGPGFGKTAIAIEVSYKLSENHNIPVVFSQLDTATSVDEMIRQLCLEVGVNHEDDPKSSLILWLRNIKRREILVMDDVDNLLEDKISFYEFIRLLRKNSNQQCQIVTTSRMSFEIPELPTCEVQVHEMDDEACVKLLRKQCSQQNDKFLRRLAEHCGNIILAMCIAAPRVRNFKDSDELVQNLERKPMETLESLESNQYVNRAIDISYEKCSQEEQETLVRLSVFSGSFSEDAARDVVEKKNLETTRILKKLVSLNLIKQTTDHRYSIHLLIKHFLKGKQKSDDEKGQVARAEAMRAEVLMVKHYLELGHQLTMESYSKDGYKDNREALKREASNIQNVLKICCQQEDPTRSDISDCLARSKIYTTSVRLFSILIGTIIPGFIFNEFLQRCANLANERNEHAIKMNFDCMLVEQARDKSTGRSDKDYYTMMKEIKKEFKTHPKDLKEDKSLCAHIFYQSGRCLLHKANSSTEITSIHLKFDAQKQLEKSLELRKKLTATTEGKVDMILSLLWLGIACNTQLKPKLEQAHKCFKEAIQLSADNLGDHELTLLCYQSYGDLLLADKKHDLAQEMYTTAKQMQENLDLCASERYVLLLNKLAMCLMDANRSNEAIEILESTRDTAEKLTESQKLTFCKRDVYTSLAVAYKLVEKYSDAAYYAKMALM